MDKGSKGKELFKRTSASRPRTSSESGPRATAEGRQRAGSVSDPSSSSGAMTSTTANLMDESNRMAALAAAAGQKAQQRKISEFMKTQGQPRPSGGAGELPSGPRGPAAGAPLEQEVTNMVQHLRSLQEEQSRATTAALVLQQVAAGAAGPSGAAVCTAEAPADAAGGASRAGQAAASAGGSGPVDDDDGGGWQTFTGRKNRKVGGDLGQEQDQRQLRGQTPFQLPGRPTYESKGYYTSSYKRNQASSDHYRTNRSSPAAALTDRQWFWFKKKLCLHCGMDHQVKDCPDLTKEESYALLRAALDCPPDMRPGFSGARRRDAPQREAAGAPRRPTPSSAPSRGAAASTAAPTTATAGAAAQKRSRDSGPEGSTGLTPEAKRTKQFSEAVKASLTLYVREKDGTALSEERYYSLKSSFAYFVEDMLTKNKDPPICSGRWTHSRSVVRIPMAGETDLLWMRCFLDKAYLVQTDEEFSRSKGKVYVAYLRDRLEPELTGMRPDKLSSFVKYYRRQARIEGLFDLKMAAKTPKGKAIHLVMDEKAEEAFVRDGCRIPFASSGWVQFEDRATYVARIKAQERQRLQPRPSELKKGLLEQVVDVSKMSVDDDDVVEVGRSAPAARGEPEKARGQPEVQAQEQVAKTYAKTLAAELQKEIREGKIEKEAAKVRFMEETGLNLDETLPRRTVSGSSWVEEVEMAKALEVPEQIAEEAQGAVVIDDEDQALFELSQEQQAQVRHRAAGSAGASGDGAVGSPSPH